MNTVLLRIQTALKSFKFFEWYKTFLNPFGKFGENLLFIVFSRFVN